ncbi:TAP binding protein (tapasin), tandem duplicate 1 [Salminus brasiliensis]|uniref:TAP binding protein (tapasin), tandem duplicate 1 n=1 Tax=Salminus brasiliensis TaxID=930266 RepID=UPI003B83646B
MIVVWDSFEAFSVFLLLLEKPNGYCNYTGNMYNSSVYTISIIAFTLFISASGCSVLECWFVQEKPGRGGGFSAAMSQEKSLIYIRTDPDSEKLQQKPPSDIDFSRIYYVTDPAATFCNSALHPPEGSLTRPQCEINPLTPQASFVKWAAALTETAQSPTYLDADWFSVAAQGIDGQLTLSNVMQASSASKEPNVILSVSSKTASISSRLGEPVLLDCGFWVDPSSPLHGSGFAVEWRYQFRGEGRLVLAYDGKSDRFAETTETGSDLDIAALYESGNASLKLEEAQVRHSGTYICTIYLPHLLAQVAMDLEIVEPPSLGIYPSPLPIFVPGQVVSVQCEASGFAPLSLDLGWELTGVDGKKRSLGQGSVTGHRQATDGTYSQSTRIELDSTKLGLGRGGEISCVANHQGGSRRASVTLNIIGVGAPSIEDSMAMVAVALVLYGVIKVFFWTFRSLGPDSEDKKDK